MGIAQVAGTKAPVYVVFPDQAFFSSEDTSSNQDILKVWVRGTSVHSAALTQAGQSSFSYNWETRIGSGLICDYPINIEVLAGRVTVNCGDLLVEASIEELRKEPKVYATQRLV